MWTPAARRASVPRLQRGVWILAFILPLSCEPIGLRATFVTSLVRLILRKFVTPRKFSKYVVFFVTWSPGCEPSSVQFLAANLRQFNISVTQCYSSVSVRIFSPTLRVWH
ncbi:hypothetical protein B0H13DRAFT_2065368 [Mycena leptocephala]|nr:hypothetical protein B0H13DRAFT_2065368 [Mycena leptocephala]